MSGLDRRDSILAGIDRLKKYVLADAMFPDNKSRDIFENDIEVLRGHVHRKFSKNLTKPDVERIERLTSDRMYEIVESLHSSGWLSQLE